MRISDKTVYTVEQNIFKSAHHVAITDTAEGTWPNNVVPHGAIYPANDATARGVVYHDTEVGQPLTLIVEGHLLAPTLPAEPTAEAQGTLKQISFYDLTPVEGA